MLVLALPDPGDCVSRGSVQRLLEDEAGTADRAHGVGGRDGPILPSLSNDTPGEMYGRGPALDASKA